ncbi:MAG TPA: AAA family ATPase [Solirubrobacterales bacterium]|nr:AAA family ATPase [Solirubrobacterales bacterium]
MLLERQDELSAIGTAIETARRGEGGALAVEAKAGLGKTRLLGEARRQATGAGIVVLSGRATELERDFPFAVLRQLLEPQLTLLPSADREALFEGAGAARGALGMEFGDNRSPDTFSVLHALYWVLAGLAERSSLLLAVDDAHLADPASLEWLAFLLPRLNELPVLLVIASRIGEPENPGLTRVLGDATVAHLTPKPLSATATKTLIEETLKQQLDPSFATASHEITGGNPFLVTELAREIADQGIEPLASQVGSVRELAPERVAQMVLGRLSRLPPEAQALARSLAVLGNDGDPSTVAELAELEPEASPRAADALRRAAILDPGETLQFIHPLVRNAVYTGLAAGERGAAHAAAAELLQNRGASLEDVATQLLVSEARGNGNVAETLLEAGQRCLKDGAPRSAVAYLTRALREPPPANLRLNVLGTLLSAGIRAADHEALATVEPEMRAALERDAAAMRWAQPLTMGMVLGGRFEEAAEILQTAIRTAIEEGNVESAFRLEAQLRTIAVVIPSAPEVDLQQHVAEIDPESPAGRLAAAIEARAAVVNGTAREAAEAARRALADDCRIFEEEPEIVSPATAVLILHISDELDSARRAADRALEIARRRDAAPALAQALFLRAFVAWGYGDVVGAEGEMRQALEITRVAEIAPLRLMFSGPFAEIMIERDELDTAEAILRETGTATGAIPRNALFAMLLLVRGHLRFERGEFAKAAEDLATVSSQGESLGFGTGPTLLGTPYAVRSLLATDRADEARKLAESSLIDARRWGAAATVSHILRGVAAARGGDEEIDALEEAVTVLDAHPRPLQRAHALVDLGSAMRRRKRRADSRSPLREGLKLARRCGAVRLAKRAQQELQASGEIVRRYAPIGVESLTPSERRVAEMAATGMTNRQIAQSLFVTLKTVEAHLSATYDKLDISSRRQLPDALARVTAADEQEGGAARIPR